MRICFLALFYSKTSSIIYTKIHPWPHLTPPWPRPTGWFTVTLLPPPVTLQDLLTQQRNHHLNKVLPKNTQMTLQLGFVRRSLFGEKECMIMCRYKFISAENAICRSGCEFWSGTFLPWLPRGPRIINVQWAVKRGGHTQHHHGPAGTVWGMFQGLWRFCRVPSCFWKLTSMSGNTYTWYL